MYYDNNNNGNEIKLAAIIIGITYIFFAVVDAGLREIGIYQYNSIINTIVNICLDLVKILVLFGVGCIIEDIGYIKKRMLNNTGLKSKNWRDINNANISYKIAETGTEYYQEQNYHNGNIPNFQAVDYHTQNYQTQNYQNPSYQEQFYQNQSYQENRNNNMDDMVIANSKWECSCGYENSANSRYCVMCGKKKSE